MVYEGKLCSTQYISAQKASFYLSLYNFLTLFHSLHPATHNMAFFRQQSAGKCERATMMMGKKRQAYRPHGETSS
jgi:hypothetical protein